jgi:hypothetical protein
VRAAPKHKHIHEFLRHDITSGLPNPRMQAHHLPKASLWVGYFRALATPYTFLTTVDASPYPVEVWCPAIPNRLLLFMSGCSSRKENDLRCTHFSRGLRPNKKGKNPHPNREAAAHKSPDDSPGKQGKD